MKRPKVKPKRRRVAGRGSRAVCTQFGALCWRRREGKVQVLLITSRGRGRWIIPKGWPIDGETPANAAATEAWEEAGARGKVSNDCLGIYSYDKVDAYRREALSCVVAVFPLKVKSLKESYPEHGQRKRRWVSAKKAAKLVEEKELARLILSFTPKAAQRRIAAE